MSGKYNLFIKFEFEFKFLNFFPQKGGAGPHGSAYAHFYILKIEKMNKKKNCKKFVKKLLKF